MVKKRAEFTSNFELLVKHIKNNSITYVFVFKRMEYYHLIK